MEENLSMTSRDWNCFGDFFFFFWIYNIFSKQKNYEFIIFNSTLNKLILIFKFLNTHSIVLIKKKEKNINKKKKEK